MDIVERLRVFIRFEDRADYQNHVVWKAADEIEKLREERNRLREALGTIAATKSINEINPDVDARMMWIGCTQIADAALKEKE